ncbi:hypothetical protein HETIRDRAFT_384379 [Heterobasidion irregulare TC 32-1]|uniref:Uncharacterized protein n=1 Tax=Heterobasidion irregulare (strain TC 32-1) TaxID=747525 RepID=W4K7X9_HETIT|nr:uncharacterized protein HETIRDRAFT_384379 [Heterobasidion irregulare TC 32-1]ETW81932.1 hypothetical protein HETIRDRAFT_384379 [Heterobasidion irregulare TC 32-1]
MSVSFTRAIDSPTDCLPPRVVLAGINRCNTSGDRHPLESRRSFLYSPEKVTGQFSLLPVQCPISATRHLTRWEMCVCPRKERNRVNVLRMISTSSLIPYASLRSSSQVE